MQIEELLTSSDFLGWSGHALSTEEAVVLHNSLLLLQHENHWRGVFLWGRIFGSHQDYWIAMGYIRDALKGLIYYYSTDNGASWVLLPWPATDRAIALSRAAAFCFHGDPALVTDVACEEADFVTQGLGTNSFFYFCIP